MAIRLGSTNVTKVALGASTLSKVMVGTVEVWSAATRYTKAPASYTAYTGSYNEPPQNTWVVVASHTIPAGSYFGTISATTVWNYAHSTSTHLTAIFVGGVQVGYGKVQDVDTGASATHTVTTGGDVVLPGGAVVEIRCYTNQSNGLYREIKTSSSWRID